MCQINGEIAGNRRNLEMPTVGLYKRGKSWYVRYNKNGKDERIKVSNHKKTAERIRAELQIKFDKEEFEVEPDLVEISLNDLAKEFLNTKKNRVGATTLTRYNQYLYSFTNFIQQNFSAKFYAHMLKEIHVDECIQSLFSKGNSSKTANETLSLIKGMFKYAKEHHNVLENPAKNLRNFPDAPVKAVEYFSKEEMELILKNSPEHWRDVFEFFYLTGLRDGELVNLTWSDVNLQTKQIAIESKSHWKTKTKNVRHIPLNDKAVKILQRCKKHDNHDFVFTPIKDSKISKGYARKVLIKVLTKLGLTGHIHKLRHTFASHLVMSSVSIYDVSQLLGHTDIKMTKKYAHLAPDYLKEQVDKL